MTARVTIDRMIERCAAEALDRELLVETLRARGDPPEHWRGDLRKAEELRAAERLLAKVANPRVADRIRAILQEADAVEKKAREAAATRFGGQVVFADGAASDGG